MKRVDILNLEWPNSDRDLNIVTPTLVYLQKKHNLTFHTRSIFLGYFFILKYRPKILVLSNFQGSSLNNEIVKFAYNSGMKVITFISEGNVKPEALEQFLWGWNKEKKLYVDKMLLWSKRSEKLFLTKYPDLKNKLFTTGASGFDRYKLIEFKSKSEFLEENKFKFKKIIGFAAWGFDHYFGEYYRNNEDYYISTFGKEQISMHKNDLFKLQKIYKELINANKDTLFILRYHPGTLDFEKNEFFGLDKLDNVFISNKFQGNNYAISDLINISDLWIGYETTTALESWLLGKKTFLINPTTSEFIRENLYKGSPIVKETQEAQLLIDEYFNTGSIEKFENLEKYRKAIVKDVIEYEDGLNYVRAGEEIFNIYKKKDKKIKFSFFIFKKMAEELIRTFLSKTFFKHRWPNLLYNKVLFKSYRKQYDKIISVD